MTPRGHGQVRGPRARGVLLALAIAACGGGGGAARDASGVARLHGRPLVASVVREGDPAGAVVMVLWTGGLAADAAPAAALAGVLEERLARVLPGAEVVLQAEAVRVRKLVRAGPAQGDEARAAATAMASAVREPVREPSPELDAARRKLGALAHLRLPDAGFAGAALCAQAPFSAANAAPSALADVERWRGASAGLGRVAFATAGPAPLHAAIVGALGASPTWPTAAAPSEGAIATTTSVAFGPRATTRVQIVVPVAPQRAGGTAHRAASGPLAVRLRALGDGARLDAATGVARPSVGCASLDLVIEGDAEPARIAQVAALAQAELELAAEGDAPAPAPTDPREAAEQAALLALAEGAAPVVPRGGAVAVTLAAPHATPAAEGELADRARRIGVELGRARDAARAPVVEGRTRVEQGQGELWVLLGSPCGTLNEGEDDAGAAALFVTAAARAGGVEPWVATDGVGLIAHEARRDGEGDAELARRVADRVGRAWATDALDALAPARRALLDAAPDSSLVALAAGLAPGHPSWILPLGTPDGLARISAGAVATRAAALRAGPLRAAILANTDAAQAAAALRATDRWIARRPGEARSCGPSPTAATPAPGMHRGGPRSSTVALAFPVPDEARALAADLAAILDGPGVLGRALASRGVARSVSSRVVGPPHAPAVVVTVSAPDGAIDAAIAEARGAIERLRRGAADDAELARALGERARTWDAELADPRQRLLRLFRGAPLALATPSPAELRRAMAATFRDEALVVGAARAGSP